MHVLLISRSFPHHRTGGLESHGQLILDGLMARGHRVSVITTPLPAQPALEILAPNGRLIEWGGKPGLYDPKFFADVARRLRRTCQRLRPDVIHAQGFAGVPAFFLVHRAIPVVTTVHGTLWSETPVHRARGMSIRVRLYARYGHRVLFAPLWRQFLRQRPPLVVDSRFTAEALVSEAGRRDLKAAVVPLGVPCPPEEELLSRQEARAQLGYAANDVLLLAVGRMEEVKGVRMLAGAFERLAAKHPGIRLVMVGDGTLLGELRRQLRSGPAATRAHLPGALSSARTQVLLAAADLFINPDTGDPAFGLSNAEALCHGVPVLTTRRGAHPEVVRADHGEGWLVEPAPESIEAELERILPNLPEPEELRLRRRKVARRRFSADRMLARLELVYARAIRRHALG